MSLQVTSHWLHYGEIRVVPPQVSTLLSTFRLDGVRRKIPASWRDHVESLVSGVPCSTSAVMVLVTGELEYFWSMEASGLAERIICNWPQHLAGGH